MEHHEIKLLFELPALRILRGPNAVMVLGFLYRAFKRHLRVEIAESELQAMMDAYLEDLRVENTNAYPESASAYLTRWCEDSHGFLRKYYGEDRREPLYELTSGAEKALLWLESLRQTGFVGTESRLQGIFNGLEEILKFATGDVDERIARLTQEAGQILAEIDRIRATGEVRTFTPVEINERFALVLRTARELLGDFRLVEENFKGIARDIAEQHTLPGVTKGAIVGSTLSAHEALRQSAQGQSFFAFWELLVTESRRRQFEQTLTRVMSLEALDDTLRSNRLLRQLISHLLIEGEQVAGSHQRLSVNLRRVLDTANLQDRRRLLDLIHEIQKLALTVKERARGDDFFFELSEFPDVYSGMSRPSWYPNEGALLSGPIEMADAEIGLEELRRFRNLPQIRLQLLRRNIEDCLSRRATATLQQVLEAFPPDNGVMEVLGYLILASRERRHFISGEYQPIEISTPRPQRWRLPLVMFCRE
jgi:hypothetical protein